MKVYWKTNICNLSLNRHFSFITILNETFLIAIILLLIYEDIQKIYLANKNSSNKRDTEVWSNSEGFYLITSKVYWKKKHQGDIAYGYNGTAVNAMMSNHLKGIYILFTAIIHIKTLYKYLYFFSLGETQSTTLHF